MVKLIINNSTCQLEGLSISQFKDLREILSYESDPQAAYFSGSHRGTKRYLIDKKGFFPTGLLYLAEDYLRKPSSGTLTVHDQRRRPKSQPGLFNLTLPHTPYPEQEKAAQACVEHDRGIVSAVTALGKSTIAALIIHKLQVRTLVVVPSLELKKQLTGTLRSAFGANMVGALDDARPIAVENVDALDPTTPCKGYDCVIIDEFHRSGAATYRKLNKTAWAPIYYKFGMTATPFRSQENERLLLESVLSKVIYRIGYPEALKKGYITPVEAYYVDLPKREVKGYTWAEVYSELVVNNDHRNKVISDLLLKLKASGASTLCLVKEIAHGDKLSETTGIPFANGLADNTRELILEFALDERKDLIGTTGILGEGVDTKPAEYVIIAGLGKAKGQFMQQIGRGLRRYPGKDSCKIIIFKDRSHKFTLRHFREQCKILREEYGVEVVKLDI